MKLAALLSGGKDSLYAAYLAKKQGHEIKFIVSILSENAESYMFHVPNIDLVSAQAEAMGLPLIEKRTKGQKEEELNDLRDVLSGIKGIDGVVSGALASNYQKTRIDKLCKELKLESVAPLWQINQETYLKNLIKDGFNAVIVAVAAPPLDEKWLGKSLNEQTVGELVALNKKHGISLVGEGGEFDTFVTDCPLFRKKIEIIDSEKVWDKKTRSGQLEIKKVKLADKHL